ncbi:unnamed protein product [Brachionus calyciflorus]|uniref:Phosphotransferase n=1 Tax=Brachionus calyciflorus TaxID=104777 RepID=A0A813Q110_9BILA|nr:unnamed protein product [Brachionus calyciflorus]
MSQIPIDIPIDSTSENIANETFSEIIKSNTNTLRNLIRKLFNTSASTVSIGLIGLLGYAIYKSYKPSKSSQNSKAQATLLNYVEPDIGKFKRPKEQIDEIQKRLDEFKLSDEILKQVMDILEAEIEKGLNRSTNSEADLKMLPTYVCQLPTGKESNDILALDLGGSNFRVLYIRLRENEQPIIVNKVFIVSESIMKGTGEKLFSHIANCLYLFMKNHNLDLNRTYPLGFTFSFPCRQLGLSKAMLLRWTKGFSCSDVVGEDIVATLQRYIDARGDIKVKVCVLINDTVGTLMSTAYYDRKTSIGLILGTGTNVCYIENIDRIGTLDPFDDLDQKQMLVNTEWGAFGENGSIDFIRSRYDDEIDKTSINIGKQIFEKMVSGMYLGELVRLMILELIDRELIFVEEMKKNAYRHALFTKGSFYTKYLNEIESDSNTKFTRTKRILKELAGIENLSNEDCAVVKCICMAVTKRAGKLVAAGLAVILKRMNRAECTIAVDGSLFRYHPRLQAVLEKTLTNLVSSLNKFKIALSTDGSGRGAAVVAAVAAENDPIFK